MTYNAELQSNNAELQEILDAVNNLPDAVEETELQEKSVEITENGSTVVTPDEGKALNKVSISVDVPIPDGYIVPNGTKNISANGTHDVKAYESVAVDVPIPDGYIQPSGELAITENGNYDITDKATVSVAVPETVPNLQEKTVTPTKSEQIVTPDSGYDGLSNVTVKAMIAAWQSDPKVEVYSDGLVSASVTQTAGYVDAGTVNGGLQLPTQSGMTVTPTTSDKLAVSSGKYTTGDITVKGDPNLVPENIVSGVSIFGVLGCASAGGSGSGSGEMVSITLSEDRFVMDFATTLYFSDGSELSEFSETGTYRVPKNSIIVLVSDHESIDVGGSFVQVANCYSDYTGTVKAFFVTGDMTIHIQG